MADKFMFIHNDDTQHFPLYRLQLVVEMFIHSTYSNEKCYCKTLGTIVINISLFLKVQQSFYSL